MAVVDANVEKHGTRDAAVAYRKFLYTDAAQETFAKHFYRPIKAEILQKHSKALPAIELYPITSFEKNWDEAIQKHFGDGGVFDVIAGKK